MFSQAYVILFTGGVSASVHAGIHPPWEQAPSKADTPLGADTPQSRHLLGADTPWSRHPPGADIPPGADTHPPPHRACWETRWTRGRYASYWNAILLKLSFLEGFTEFKLKGFNLYIPINFNFWKVQDKDKTVNKMHIKFIIHLFYRYLVFSSLRHNYSPNVHHFLNIHTHHPHFKNILMTTLFTVITFKIFIKKKKFVSLN